MEYLSFSLSFDLESFKRSGSRHKSHNLYAWSRNVDASRWHGRSHGSEIPAQIQFLPEPRDPFMQNVRPRTRFNVSVRPSPTGSAGLNLWTIRWRAAGFSRVSSLVKVKEVVEVHESGEEKFEGINSVFFEGLWIRIRIGCDNNYDICIHCSLYSSILEKEGCLWRDTFYSIRFILFSISLLSNLSNYLISAII